MLIVCGCEQIDTLYRIWQQKVNNICVNCTVTNEWKCRYLKIHISFALLNGGNWPNVLLQETLTLRVSS
jgi:hypothetical protein